MVVADGSDHVIYWRLQLDLSDKGTGTEDNLHILDIDRKQTCEAGLCKLLNLFLLYSRQIPNVILHSYISTWTCFGVSSMPVYFRFV